jgi:hypothetical protein
MKGSTVLSHLCLLVVGILGGIWMLWSAPNSRNLKYVVEPYPRANLQVSPNEKINLEDGTEQGISWTLSFVGTVPCLEGNNVNPCTLKPKLGKGSYFFNCTSSQVAGNGCPDPGIQPSPTTGPIELGYWATLAKAFRLGGAQAIKTGGPGNGKAPAPVAPTSSEMAIVSCNTSNNVTIVQDASGDDRTTIHASNNEAVYWTGSDPFTLSPISYPSNFCGSSPPKVDNDGVNAECTVGANVPQNTSMTYTVTATNPDTGNPCGPSQGTNVTVP